MSAIDGLITQIAEANKLAQQIALTDTLELVREEELALMLDLLRMKGRISSLVEDLNQYDLSIRTDLIPEDQ